MLLDADQSQLLLIDYQPRLMPAIHEGEAILVNARRLAQMAGLADVPVFGTEQNPSRLGQMQTELRDHCRRVMAKMQFSAVAEGLGEWLRPPARPVQGNARSLPVCKACNPHTVQRPARLRPGAPGLAPWGPCIRGTAGAPGAGPARRRRRR